MHFQIRADGWFERSRWCTAPSLAVILQGHTCGTKVRATVGNDLDVREVGVRFVPYRSLPYFAHRVMLIRVLCFS